MTLCITIKSVMLCYKMTLTPTILSITITESAFSDVMLSIVMKSVIFL
jgi:hypothetical protein